MLIEGTFIDVKKLREERATRIGGWITQNLERLPPKQMNIDCRTKLDGWSVHTVELGKALEVS
ncbi:hypothetical protein GCM10028810_00900 [Spirosoma litoris]